MTTEILWELLCATRRYWSAQMNHASPESETDVTSVIPKTLERRIDDDDAATTDYTR